MAVVVTSCAHVPESDHRVHTYVFSAKLIRTMNPELPTAEAVVVRGDKVLFVGSKREALEAAGPDAVLESFPESVIVPGLVDAHVHLSSLGRSLSIVNLLTATTEAGAVALVAAAATNPAAHEGDWLVGDGWDQNDWPTKAYPTKASLDAVSPAAPVYLSRVDGHAAWVNSEALRRAKVTKATKDPAGGRIERDASGEPTGVLVDNAMDLVGALLPQPSLEVKQKRLKRAVEWCARLGLTQVHDAGMDLATFSILQNWDALGLLPVRVYAMAAGQGDEAEQYLERGPFSGRRLEMRAVKLLADGALGSRGAALLEPYSDAADQTGLLLVTPEVLEAKAKAFAERGFQVAIHAIGDRANSLAISTLSKLGPGGRHRVEHAQILAAGDLDKFAKFGLIASFQPTHATSDMPWAEQRVGPERVKWAYAWRSVLDAKGHVAFGSDFPVEDPNPLWGLYAARTRQDHQGLPVGGWHPEQKVTGDEALAGFTTGAAYAAFAEERRGQLKAGFDADLVVLPVDPVEGEPKRLLDAKVQVTVVDGIDVYRAEAK